MYHRSSVILVFMACAAVATQTFGEAPPASDAGPGVPLLRKLVEQGKLTLSNDKQSAAERFFFRFFVRAPDEDGGEQGFQAFVVRDGGRVAIIITTLDDLCYAYIMDGKMIAVDTQHPGGLIEYKGGSPQFVFAVGQDREHVEMKVSLAREAGQPKILLDLGSIITTALPKITESNYAAKTGLVYYRTARAQSQVRLFPEAADVPIRVREFAVKVNAGPVFDVAVAASLNPKNDYFNVTDERVKGLNLPVRSLDVNETIPVIVPRGFGKGEPERMASEKLASLLPQHARLADSDAARLDRLRRAAFAPLDRVTRIAGQMDEVTQAQREALNQLVQEKKETFEKAVEQMDRGEIPPEEVARVAMESMNLQGSLKRILGPSFSAFVKRWASAAQEQAKPPATRARE